MGLVQSEIPEFPGAGTTLKIFKANCMNVSVFVWQVWVSDSARYQCTQRYSIAIPVYSLSTSRWTGHFNLIFKVDFIRRSIKKDPIRSSGVRKQNIPVEML